MHILLLTNKWPRPARPATVPFLVQQVDFLRQAGIIVTRFTFLGAKNPFRYAAAWLQLRRRFRLTDFDLIHAHFGQCGLIALPAPRPLVVTYHGSDLQGDWRADGRPTRRGAVMRAVSRFVARRATANIVVARHLLTHLPADLPPAHVIPCGVDFDRFFPLPQAEARRRLELPATEILALFAADPRRAVKNYPLAQAAVDAARAAGTAVRLITLGQVPPEEIPLYLNACDVLLLTSHHEGSPTIVKEALACRLPVVAVPVGDVAEQLAPVHGCVVTPLATPTAVADGLQRVLAHRHRLSPETDVAHFDERRLVGQLIDVYQSVTAGADR